MNILRIALFFIVLLIIPISAYAGVGKLTYSDQPIVVDARFFQQHEYIAHIPDGYVMELLARDLEHPRMLTFATNGDLFAGSQSGKIYRLQPPYKHAEVLVELGDYPHSVAFRDGEILIAQTNGLYRAPYRSGQAEIDRRDVKLMLELPGGRGHNSRTVRIGSDNNVYVSLGISRNCSDEYLGREYPSPKRRGGILVLSKDNQWKAYATGLRNPVGFDWHPITGQLYAGNNGPDHWGYEQPPEYFSLLEPGSFHGMPWFQFNGHEILRDSCLAAEPPRPQTDVVAPVAIFPARNAPMGVAFVPPKAMDKELEGDAIVALHGSWATQPDGGSRGDPATRRPPKLVVVRFDNGKADRVDDLITGFQFANGKRWLRPVGVAVGPDGALYFSSDTGIEGIFRLRRK